jgi:hypothetical protein
MKQMDDLINFAGSRPMAFGYEGRYVGVDIYRDSRST